MLILPFFPSQPLFKGSYEPFCVERAVALPRLNAVRLWPMSSDKNMDKLKTFLKLLKNFGSKVSTSICNQKM
jgi:hypothetical protein